MRRIRLSWQCCRYACGFLFALLRRMPLFVTSALWEGSLIRNCIHVPGYRAGDRRPRGGGVSVTCGSHTQASVLHVHSEPRASELHPQQPIFPCPNLLEPSDM